MNNAELTKYAATLIESAQDWKKRHDDLLRLVRHAVPFAEQCRAGYPVDGADAAQARRWLSAIPTQFSGISNSKE